MTRIITFNKGELVATYENWPRDIDENMDHYWHTGDWYTYMPGQPAVGKCLYPEQVPANLRAIVLLLT